MGIGGFLGTLFSLLVREKPMERPRVFTRREQKMRSRNRDIAASTVKFPVFRNEIGRNPVAQKVSRATCMIHSDREILVHLEVQVRGVHSVIVADRPHLLSTGHVLSLPYHDFVEVPVK